MSTIALPSGRILEVDAAFRTLPDRYLGAQPGFDATYHLRLGDIGVTYEVRLTEHAVRVTKGTTRRTPDVVIGTDARTWLALRQGDINGVEAFMDGRLTARGDVDLAIGFEGMFLLPNGRPPLLRRHDVRFRSGSINVVTMAGDGPDVLLIHGLGSSKASFYDTAGTLSRAGYRVHAIDLPGFGSSSKPKRAPYTAGWFAEAVIEVLEAMEIDRVHLVGHSMGGRIALEVGLRAPHLVQSVACLCPAVAFIKREWSPLVRMLPPQLGILPHRFHRSIVSSQLSSLFVDPDALDPSVRDLVVDEFQRIYSSAGARLAFVASARNIYLDRPYGKGGFYPRLAGLSAPTAFIWGSKDWLIPAGFESPVAKALPGAEQHVFDGCGHAPQIECPERTVGVLQGLFARADAALTGGGRTLAQAA